MSLIPIYCDICGEHIASAEQDGLRLPLAGSMFKPREAGFPDPFPEEVDWEFMRCPFGPHRPFIAEHLLQVGPLSPGCKPVLDLAADAVPDAEPEAEEEPVAPPETMPSLSDPERQGEEMAKPAGASLQPQARQPNAGRSKRRKGK